MVADIYGVTAQAWVVFGVPVGHGCRICTVADIRGAMCYGGCRIIMVADICGAGVAGCVFAGLLLVQWYSFSLGLGNDGCSLGYSGVWCRIYKVADIYGVTCRGWVTPGC